MIFVFLTLFVVVTEAGICNHNDREIYKTKGKDFPDLFRSFGGLFVSQSSYEDKIKKETGLSALCARCYGDAYICGFDNCKMACALQLNTRCKDCLSDHDCTQKCDECTGFTSTGSSS